MYVFRVVTPNFCSAQLKKARVEEIEIRLTSRKRTSRAVNITSPSLSVRQTARRLRRGRHFRRSAGAILARFESARALRLHQTALACL